jgi:protein tyrosine phosphatase (PTP) superfamily phosphohydrolase (DUF442 family)
MNDIKNFLRISDRLACSGQPNESQLAQIAAGGYEVVINLGLADGKYALPDEAASVNKLGLAYYHIPVLFESPQLTQWTQFMAIMKQHRDKKTLVHCAANYRATAFTGLYLLATNEIDRKGLSPFIAQVWTPNPVWQQFIDEAIRQPYSL